MANNDEFILFDVRIRNKVLEINFSSSFFIKLLFNHWSFFSTSPLLAFIRNRFNYTRRIQDPVLVIFVDNIVNKKISNLLLIYGIFTLFFFLSNY
jgi:hypothetical protein